VRIFVGFPAGSGIDRDAHIVGEWLAARLGQSFDVENRLGAGTNIATEAVVRAPPDGYTLLLANTANAINATLYDRLNFNFVRDIAPVAGLVSVPIVMVVNPSFPAKTVRNSSPMPRPIQARSLWRRPLVARCPIWRPRCSR